MHVELIYALPDEQHRLHLELAPGATVADVLEAARKLAPFSDLPLERMPVGVYGRLVERDHALGPDDRVELYRPLPVDPKEARRRRAEGQ